MDSWNLNRYPALLSEASSDLTSRRIRHNDVRSWPHFSHRWQTNMADIFTNKLQSICEMDSLEKWSTTALDRWSWFLLAKVQGEDVDHHLPEQVHTETSGWSHGIPGQSEPCSSPDTCETWCEEKSVTFWDWSAEFQSSPLSVNGLYRPENGVHQASVEVCCPPCHISGFLMDFH